MKPFYFFSTMVIMFAINANAQLKVNNSGKVAVAATNSDFIPMLSVGNNCHFFNDNTFRL